MTFIRSITYILIFQHRESQTTPGFNIYINKRRQNLKSSSMITRNRRSIANGLHHEQNINQSQLGAIVQIFRLADAEWHKQRVLLASK